MLGKILLKEIEEKFDERINAQLKIMAGLADEGHRYGYGKALEAYQQSKLLVEDIIRSNMKDDGWIPCSERLPEDGTYWCTLDGELCGIDEPFTGMCGIENGVWDEPDCVIAWQPLPAPYHLKEEN